MAAGQHPIECLCGVAILDEYTWESLERIPSKWQPKPDDPWVVTTMAVGEEGGGLSPIWQL